jgi:CheY-like chemotaxis protein
VALNSAKGIDLLAGRKLLLADDSITIQKVVDLTFADEGVRVIAVNNGWEAVEKLDEIVPDVVLADVFMPEMTGYELCEYIKQTDKLKHIPVMLLVGSFEPFDEAEARRVGADDILTKPFQSIRKLIDKVGGLVGGQKAEEVPTAQLPKQEVVTEPEKLSTAELEMTTADTRQLPEDLASMAMEAKNQVSEPEVQEELEPINQTMEHSPIHSQDDGMAPSETDVLLELGDLSTDETIEEEEFVLDLDMDEQLEPEPVGAYASSGRTFVEPQIAEAQATSWQQTSVREEGLPGGYNTGPQVDRMAATQEFPRPGFTETTSESVYQRITDEPEDFVRDTNEIQGAGSSRKITLDQLSPEVIDAIARRAVEMMSTKVVEEIAWEVVPQLSELLIKRQLEEKK